MEKIIHFEIEIGEVTERHTGRGRGGRGVGLSCMKATEDGVVGW
jgi:hypothetical protein